MEIVEHSVVFRTWKELQLLTLFRWDYDMLLIGLIHSQETNYVMIM